MTKPHSHRGEPRDEEHDGDREPHIPAHIASDPSTIQNLDEPEAQRA